VIVALLILIVLIMLFGAGAVKGWIKGGLAWGAALVVLLLAVGFVGSRYKRAGEAREHTALVAAAKPMILEDVATKVGKAVAALTDIVTYDQDTEVYLCGSIMGTAGYGGPDGRQRFLSNGGNTELERPGARAQFDERSALHCTMDATSATMR
jgi:hypothetical protein